MLVTGPRLICRVTWHLILGRASVLTPSSIESLGRTVVIQTLGRVGVLRRYPRVASREFILVCDCSYSTVFLKVNSCAPVNSCCCGRVENVCLAVGVENRGRGI